MGARMRTHDWAATALGPSAQWPAALKAVVSAVINSPVLGTVLWGPELRMLYNDAYIPSLADRHPAALGRPVAEVWGEAWTQVAPPFFHLLETGQGFSQSRVELPVLRRGVQETTWWDFSAAPIRDDSGAIVGILNQGAEVTRQVLAERELEAARSRAEAELRQLNRELEARVAERTAERDQMWNTSPDLMLIIGFDGVLKRVNPAWTSMLGYTAEELVGHHVNEFVVGPDHDQTVQAYQLAADGGRPRIENRYRHRDGSLRSISWVAAPTADMTYATGRDVTDERRRQAELEAAQEQLRQSQKMDAIGQLTGGLAHDFNNLLGGISASLQVLQARIGRGKTEGMERYLQMAQDSVRRAASLTHRLLAFSRRQTLDPKPVDVNLLVAGMEELVRRTVGVGSQVRVEGVGALWPVKVDVSQLENSLLNLCINARDAMLPGGGRLTIQTGNKSLGERAAKPLGLVPGEYVSICVTDTGTGMTPEVQARAFDPFFTTKPIGQGTGLGLSMVYGFVRQSGGQVHIDSRPGHGTTLCMHLPRHVGDAAPEVRQATEEPIEPGDGETVLLIEDEGTIRVLVSEVLEEAGYRVLSADDGPSGLAILESDRRIDLLVTDVGLPGGLNGRQVADAARVGRPGLKVLFITGYAENAAVGNGQMESGMEVLTKPFELGTLASRVRRLLEG